MGTINYEHEVSASVWVISGFTHGSGTVEGIEKGTVSYITTRTELKNLVVTTVITYGIKLLTPGIAGIVEYDSTDVFADKATALTEYDTRLGV